MENQFTDLSVPDANATYYCSPHTRTTGFTHLMKLVLMVRTHPEALLLIKDIIGNDINARNHQKLRFFFLPFAVRYG